MKPLNKEEYIGKRYSRLVIKDVTVVKWESFFICVCDCGAEVKASSYNVKNGHTKSCGCARIEHGCNKTGNRKHIYGVWDAMIQRCTNENSLAYHNYGGRGITVCERWKDFKCFYSDLGDTPAGMELDRIDVNGNYEPENVRWISHKENNRNKRNNVYYEFNGRTQTIQAWSEETGIPYGCLRSRIVRGWPLERVFTEAPKEANFNGRNKSRIAVVSQPSSTK